MSSCAFVSPASVNATSDDAGSAGQPSAPATQTSQYSRQHPAPDILFDRSRARACGRNSERAGRADTRCHRTASPAAPSVSKRTNSIACTLALPLISPALPSYNVQPASGGQPLRMLPPSIPSTRPFSKHPSVQLCRLFQGLKTRPRSRSIPVHATVDDNWFVIPACGLYGQSEKGRRRGRDGHEGGPDTVHAQ